MIHSIFIPLNERTDLLFDNLTSRYFTVVSHSLYTMVHLLYWEAVGR